MNRGRKFSTLLAGYSKMESDLERDEEEILSFISGTWNESTVRKSEGYAKKLQEWLKTKKNVVSVCLIVLTGACILIGFMRLCFACLN